MRYLRGDITIHSIFSVLASKEGSTMANTPTTATNQSIGRGGFDVPRVDGDLVPDQSAILKARNYENNTTMETQHDG